MVIGRCIECGRKMKPGDVRLCSSICKETHEYMKTKRRKRRQNDRFLETR